MIDLDVDALDYIKKSDFSTIYHDESFINDNGLKVQKIILSSDLIQN